MRRAFLAMALGGVLLTAAACDSDAEPTAAAPATEATPSAEPTTPAPDYSADTRKVCGQVDVIFDKDIAAFSAQMGRMIARKEAKATPAEAKAAQTAASGKLKTISASLRKTTAAAQDPDLQAAGAASATKFTKAAANSAFFARIKTQKDFDKTIQSQLNNWMSPVSGFCAQ